MRRRGVMERWSLGAVVLGLGALLCAVSARGEAADAPWRLSLMGGRLDFEGDEAVEDTFSASAAVGYSLSDLWEVELNLQFAPKIDEKFRDDLATGTRVSRLEEATGSAAIDDTQAARFGAAFVFHPAGPAKVDPYILAGAGMAWYDDAFMDEWEPELHAGGGILFRLCPAWAVRTEARVFYMTDESEYGSVVSAGVMWTPGAGARPRAVAPVVEAPAPVKEPAPSLPPPAPRIVDSDWDGLTDVDEVSKHQTDPMKRDTDGGGVADGHEVIEDKTDPLKKADDLEMYELRIEFDEDSAEVAAQYFEHLDVIGKILRNEPETTARIEGHIDQNRTRSDRQAMRLTEKRARSVRDYLSGDKWKISTKRLDAVGYGFSRPKEKPDLDKGNRENRRIEVYIRRLTAKPEDK